MIRQSNPNLDLKTHDNDYVENEFLSFNMLNHQKMPTLQESDSYESERTGSKH